MSEPAATGVFFLGTLILLAGTIRVLARLGGWSKLADTYPARSPFIGRRFRFQFVQLAGWVGYNGCVTAGSDPFTLYLSLWPILRLGHPPLLIPWSEVSARIERRRGFPVVLLTFARAPGVEVRISGRLAGRLAEESRGSFRIADPA